MKMSGSIRRKEGNPRRAVVRRQSPRPGALSYGTAAPGPEVHHSGPGLLFSPDPTAIVHTVLSCAAPRHGVSSYFIPLEQKIPLGSSEEKFL